MATKVLVCVSLVSSGKRKHSFTPPIKIEEVLQSLERLYGIGHLEDQEGDTVVDRELRCGAYQYIPGGIMKSVNEILYLVKEVAASLKRFRQDTGTYASNYSQIGDEIMQRGDFEDIHELDIWKAFQSVDVKEKLKWTLLYECKSGISLKGKTWEMLAPLEVQERQRENSSYKIPELKGEAVLQLGLGYVFRVLEKGGFNCKIMDTSLSGLYCSREKPDYTCFTVSTKGRGYSLVRFTGELKDEFTTTDYRMCIGEQGSRMRNILEHQKRRVYAYGFIADKSVIQFMKVSNVEGVEQWMWTGKFDLSLKEDSPGLELLMKMLCADDTLHGYVPPPILQQFFTTSGKPVHHIQPFWVGGSPVRGCVVYSAMLDEKDVAVKVCAAAMDLEISILKKASQIEGVLELLDDGKLDDSRSYLITPLCQPVYMDRSDGFYLTLIRQVANTVNRLWQAGIVHGDISVGNIVTKDEQAYLIDFGSATHEFKEGKPTGTLTFMAVQTLRDGTRCLSSELECLMYLLVYFALEGKTPWGRKKNKDDIVTQKIAIFFDETLFQKEILSNCKLRGVLRDAICRLKVLFWNPVYVCNVTFEDFVAALE